jgi:hypothetical protein
MADELKTTRRFLCRSQTHTFFYDEEVCVTAPVELAAKNFDPKPKFLCVHFARSNSETAKRIFSGEERRSSDVTSASEFV